jgi:hypothetical protein
MANYIKLFNIVTKEWLNGLNANFNTPVYKIVTFIYLLCFTPNTGKRGDKESFSLITNPGDKNAPGSFMIMWAPLDFYHPHPLFGAPVLHPHSKCKQTKLSKKRFRVNNSHHSFSFRNLETLTYFEISQDHILLCMQWFFCMTDIKSNYPTYRFSAFT